MKERSILFSAPMVKAILAGKKTQTRRIVRAQPTSIVGDVLGQPKWYVDADPDKGIMCPHGKPWDRLWVRETWALETLDGTDERVVWAADRAAAWRVEGVFEKVFYLESAYQPEWWRPSIHMPRWASRIDLEIVSVRCERLQDITEEDARAEGVGPRGDGHAAHRAAFHVLWNETNGERATWASNPWVWVLEFKRVRP